MKKSFKFFFSLLLFLFFISCEETIQQKLPVIENFSVSPLGTWHVDDVITLTWTVKNTDSVSIDNGIGFVPLTGTYQYTLNTPGYFNFTLTAVNPAGSIDRAIPCAVENVQIYNIWGKWFHGISDAGPHDLIKCRNGDFLIVGVTGYNIYEPSSKVSLTRVDPDGNTIWEKYFRSKCGSFGQSADEMPDGSIIVAANNHASKYPQNDFSFYLLHASSTGDLFWEKTIGGRHWRIWDSKSDNDGNYIITGESFALAGDIGFKQLYLGEFDGFNPVWEKTYSMNGPSTDESVGRRLIKTSDGGYAVVGLNWSEQQGKDVYLIKTD
jgi:hypothetical protein